MLALEIESPSGLEPILKEYYVRELVDRRQSTNAIIARHVVSRNIDEGSGTGDSDTAAEMFPVTDL